MSEPNPFGTGRDEVLHTLELESRRFRSRRKWRIGLGVAWFAFILAMVGISSLLRVQPNLQWMYIGNILLPFLGLVTLSHKRALAKAVRNCDKSTTAYLLEALSLPNEDIKKHCRDVLLGLLPTLTDADHSIFDPYQRGILYRELSAFAIAPVGPNNPAFVGAVLHAIHKTGGAEAIPFVENFEQRARKKRGDWRKLADQALLILPDLRMRAAKQIIDKKLDEVTASSEFERMRFEKLRDSVEIPDSEDNERSRLGAEPTGPV